ncbi:MAG: hypothetical protein IPI50_12045 [Saprospiraceae bacterium]|nr:hypothetical protein [Saprospiraceae bacterium]
MLNIKYLILFFGVLSTLNSNAQLGLGMQLELQSLTLNNLSSNDIGNRFSVQYMLRLKNARVEFLPGVSIGWGNTILLAETDRSIQYGEFSPQIQVPVLIYPFDFKNDCNCPTFKKSGNPVSKGLHLIGSVAFRYLVRDFNGVGFKHQVFPIGAGFGMDFGMSPYFTLSPFMMFQYVFSDKILDGNAEVQINRKEFVFGLRGQFHKDEKRKRRR